MTLVSQIIIDAYRQSNLIAIGVVPSSEETAEGLRYLNRVVKSVFGNEAGDPLEALPIGRTGIDRPSGFPGYTQTPSGDWFVPKNKRLILNLSSALTVYLHPMPDDGSRFAISDASNNLATYNLIVDGNGRRIEEAATVTLSTNGLDREWFYRQDQGNWFKLTDLVAADTFPFPEEFDDMFITMLALRFNPANGIELSEQTKAVFNRSRSQFRARYKQKIEVDSEEALLRLSSNSRYLNNGYHDTESLFNTGYFL